MEVGGYAPATLTPVQNSNTHRVGPRAGPNVLEVRKIYFSLWTQDSPARSTVDNCGVPHR
jgi:hypothetical protein